MRTRDGRDEEAKGVRTEKEVMGACCRCAQCWKMSVEAKGGV